MFRARRLCLLFFVAVVLSLQANEGLCQMEYSISKEMRSRCVETIAAYVKKNRNWDKGSYKISFSDPGRMSSVGIRPGSLFREAARGLTAFCLWPPTAYTGSALRAWAAG